MTLNLRPYQIEKANECNRILYTLKLVYLSAQVRTGKSVISLKTAELYGAKNVLFLTKKKAIESVQSDYQKFGFAFDLTVINNESMHKVDGNFDFVVMDEAHRFGSFPKPSQGAKMFKQKFGHLPIILMSGTPTPESHSQWFHQFWVSNFSPFKEPNFYKWAKRFVNIKQRHLGYGLINDYSDANIELIKPIIKPYLVTLTQAEAGFVNVINEHFVPVKMKGITYQICERLIKDKVFEGNTASIVADTAAKLQSKLHQLYSGTVKFEEGNSCIVDNSKAIAIKQMFKGKKIAIFYKFIAEKELLIDTFSGLITESLEEFNTTNKSIIGQIQSIREGVKLDKASAIVYFNIDFSALSYLQGIDRMTTIERLNSDIYWFFAENGIERRIYKSVKNKKNYSLSTFKKDFNLK